MEKKEIESIVDHYFSGQKFTRDVIMLGKIAYVRVCYWNFKTQHQVHNELTELIPMSKVEIIERLFTTEVKQKELMKMIDEDVDVIYNEGGGVFRKVPLCVALEERLFAKDIL